DLTTQQASQLGNVADIRAELRKIATNSPLVRGTRFMREFPAKWAPWERLTPAEVQGRLAGLRAQLRRLLDALTDKEQAGQAVTAEDRVKVTELESELGLGVL